MSLSRTDLHNELKSKIIEKGLGEKLDKLKSSHRHTGDNVSQIQENTESEHFIRFSRNDEKERNKKGIESHSKNNKRKRKKKNTSTVEHPENLVHDSNDQNCLSKSDKRVNDKPKFSKSTINNKQYTSKHKSQVNIEEAMQQISDTNTDIQNEKQQFSQHQKKRKATHDTALHEKKRKRRDENVNLDKDNTLQAEDARVGWKASKCHEGNERNIGKKPFTDSKDRMTDITNESEDGPNQTTNHKKTIVKTSKFQEHKESLPIYQTRNALAEITSKNDVVILVGETGSGKTTQVPQFIAEWEDTNKVVVTQPRRVAAVSVAKRVSEECGTKIGEEVGYKVRFEENYSREKGRILFVTDGMLLREAQLDPMLREWNWIILDEAHERTLHTDILFGIVKRALLMRKNIKEENGEKALSALKVVVMSATLEAATFSKFFFQAPILYVTGRQYPVDVFFTTVPQQDYLDSIVRCVLQVHIDEKIDGDILAFLTGQDEILAIQAVLEDKARFLPAEAAKLIVFPLFAALPHKQQMEAFKSPPPGCRKVILSTNIAETSITIPGIRYVVDSGVVKSKTYIPERGIENLNVNPISKASARQRTGRAGRERSGKCFRLYTEDQFEEMDEFTTPEIKRSNLATVILQMKSMGINDILSFDFLDPPPKDTLESSLKYLQLLGALDKKQNITSLGTRMAKFPLDPMYSLTLLQSIHYGCVQEILSILSMLSVESIFYSPATHREEANKAKKRFTSRYGDHLTYLYVYKSFVENKGSVQFCQNNFINRKNMKKVLDIRKQLTSYMKQLDYDTNVSAGKDINAVRKCLLSAGFLNIAMRQPQTREFKTLQHNVEVKIHPSSVIQDLQTSKLPEFVLFNVLSKTADLYIRDLTAMEREWLLDTNFSKYFRGRIPMTVKDIEEKKAVKSGRGNARFRTIVSA